MTLYGKDGILNILKFHTNDNLIVLLGAKGTGKRTTIKEYSKLTNKQYISVGNKIGDVRDIQQLASGYSCDLLLCFEDGDNITTQAQNALLKLCEEPPKNIQLVICAVNKDSLLPTIISRATMLLQPLCNKMDIQLYAKENSKRVQGGFNEDILLKISDICSTFGQVNALMEYNVDEFIAFCNKVLANINRVSIVNAFKISQSLKLKDADKGYDLELFLQVLKYLIHNQLNKLTNINLFVNFIWAINNALYNINKGMPNQMVFDQWVIDMRWGNNYE